MSSPRIRIALADDQEMVREGIKSLLALSGKVDVVVEAANGEQLLAALPGAPVDLLVMDIRMPVRDGIETLREGLHEAYLLEYGRTQLIQHEPHLFHRLLGCIAQKGEIFLHAFELPGGGKAAPGFGK